MSRFPKEHQNNKNVLFLSFPSLFSYLVFPSFRHYPMCKRNINCLIEYEVHAN